MQEERQPYQPGVKVLSLSQAVAYAIREQGPSVVECPRALVSYLLDFGDIDRPEARVLERFCNERFVAPFVRAMSTESLDGIGLATRQVASYLAGECVVKEDIAWCTATGVAQGIELGMTGHIVRSSEQPAQPTQHDSGLHKYDLPAAHAGYARIMEAGVPCEHYQSLRVAIATVLHMLGMEAIAHPARMVAVVMDQADYADVATRVFVSSCDEELLVPFRRAVELRTPEAIEVAADQALYQLSEVRCMQEVPSREVACSLAFALANSIGVYCTERVRMAAVGGGVVRDVKSAPKVPPDVVPPNSEHVVPAANKGDTQIVVEADEVRRYYNRIDSAEAAGLGMRWFEFLQGVCLGSAVVSLCLVVWGILAYCYGFRAELPVSAASVNLFQALYGAGLTVAFLASAFGLRRFKQWSPWLTEASFVAGALFPLIIYTFWFVQAAQSYEIGDFFTGESFRPVSLYGCGACAALVGSGTFQCRISVASPLPVYQIRRFTKRECLPGEIM